MGDRSQEYQTYASFRDEWNTVDKLIRISQPGDSLTAWLTRHGFINGEGADLRELLALNGASLIARDIYPQINAEFHALKQRVEQSGLNSRFDVLKEGAAAQQLSKATLNFMATLRGLAKQLNSPGKGAKKVSGALLKLNLLWAMYNDALSQWLRVVERKGRYISQATSPKELIGSLVQTIPTLVGDVAEQQLQEALNSEVFEKMIGRSVEAIAGPPLTAIKTPAGYLRGGISYTIEGIRMAGSEERGQEISFSSRAGTPLVDVAVDIAQRGTGMPEGVFNISIKEKVGQADTTLLNGMKVHSLKVLSTKFGNLMNPDRIKPENNNNPYYWYAFARVLGRLPGGSKEVQEIKNYLVSLYAEEAVFGDGEDSVSDFIINGKIFSAQRVAQLLNITKDITQTIRLTAPVQVDPLKEETSKKKGSPSKADIAIQKYISHRYIGAMLDTKAEFEIKFPSTFI